MLETKKADGKFKKGNKPMGRPKGSQNKTTLEIKKAMARAFHRAGGDEYLYKLSQTDKPLFCMLLAKVIPAELQVSGSVLIDIGTAMQQAEQRLTQHTATPIIDISPNPLINKDTSDSE